MAKNLTIMQKHHPDDYDFFPQTFLLPSELTEFKKQFKTRDPSTFIVKPSHDC
jgi:tubulin polyglutamylase TTLL6/13